jgi:hypothetical protein
MGPRAALTITGQEAQAAPEKVFRTAEDEQPITLRITALGRKALNGDAAEEAPAEPAKAPKQKAARRAVKATDDAPQPAAPAAREKKAARARKGEAAADHQPRAGTKLEQFIKLLRRAKGVSIKEAAEALDWMEHSVRGAVAGALKKKYGLTILSEKVESRGTVYRSQTDRSTRTQPSRRGILGGFPHSIHGERAPGLGSCRRESPALAGAPPQQVPRSPRRQQGPVHLRR